MCSRYSLTSPAEAVRSYFKCRQGLEFPPRYNIAPTQPVAIVRQNAAHDRELALVRWGLIPLWVKDPREFSPLINARSETAASKPSFRGSMRHRRCLVPTDGFYEWTGKPSAKQPYLVRSAGGGMMGMAGIWEHWLGADGSEIETMAILTTAANAAVATLHDRMPVIIAPENFQVWLDCSTGTSEETDRLLKPCSDGLLEIIAVSPKLNNPRNEGPAVQEQLATKV